MKLVMFDMDGTLTDSFALDENCYVLAIEQALGLNQVVTEWESYTHSSSSFCLEEIVRRARGTLPSLEESRAVQSQMVKLMSEIQDVRGRCTTEISGAATCLRLLQDRGYAVAIASGDWETTARHKLVSAQVPFETLPTAFCDCAHARTEIMRTALSRAQAHYQCETFERVVYVGDAAWDVRACRELAWPLIGIASGTHADRLRALGVGQIFANYSQPEAFFDAVEQATPPCPSSAAAV